MEKLGWALAGMAYIALAVIWAHSAYREWEKNRLGRHKPKDKFVIPHDANCERIAFPGSQGCRCMLRWREKYVQK